MSTEYRLTFGVQYASEPHPAGLWVHPDGWVAIVAPSYTEARAFVIEKFGRAWSDLYEPESFLPEFFPLGELRRFTVRPEPTCYCDADLVAPHPFSECPHRVAESTAGETRDVPTPGAAG